MGKPDVCRSCGIEWIKHPGSVLTCKRAREATALLEKLRDDSPCRFDHHGYCQEHNWLDNSECPQAGIRRLLGDEQ